jgi:hypothetical protein
MLNVLFPTLLLLAQAPAMPTEAVAAQEAAPPMPSAAPAKVAKPKPGPLKPLSFLSQSFPYRWNELIPLNVEVDGLRVDSIFFNKRTLTLLKKAEFGTRAVIQVTNTAATTRVPGFALALFDATGHLLGVASGGPKIGGVRAGDTETFDLSFHQVVERIPIADHFYLTVELSN